VYDEIKYVGVSAKRDETHFTVWVADKLVADLELQPNPYNLGQIWMMHVAVRKGNEGRGYARQLIEAAAQRAHEMGKCLSVSEFSDEGRNKLGRLFGRLKRKYPRGVLTHG
jgi:GNAT superfamily N-acetyltransferase